MLSFLHRGIGRRQICSLCLLSLVMFVLTGCWDKKEFNQIAIVQTLAVDKHENEYKVTLQLITPKAGEKGITAEDLWIISGQGESVAAALDQADLSTPRRIYLEQMNLILLGEGVLADDLMGGYRYLTRSHYLRRSNYVLAIKGEAGEIIAAKPELGKIDIFYLTNLIKDQERKIKNSVTLVNDCLLAAHSTTGAVFIPAVILEAKEKLTLDGGALVKNNQLVDWVDQAWTESYYWVCGEIKQKPLVLQDVWQAGDMVVLEVEKSRCHLVVKQQQPLVIGLEIEAELDMVDNRGVHNVADEKELEQSLAQVRQRAEQEIEAIVKEGLDKAQSLNCDAFNLGQWLAAFHQSVAAQYDWQKDFKDIELEVEVKTEIKSLLINQK